MQGMQVDRNVSVAEDDEVETVLVGTESTARGLMCMGPRCMPGDEEGPNDNDDALSDGDNGPSNKPVWKRKGMHLVAIGMVCAVSAVLLISQTTAGAPSGSVGTPTTHGVFDAPQFEELLLQRVQPILGSTIGYVELSGHIRHQIRNLKETAEQHLPKAQAEVLKNAKLTMQNWQDFKDMQSGVDHPVVQEAGKITLSVLRDNLFSSEKEMTKHLKDALAPSAYQLMKLRSQIVPEQVDRRLGAWAAAHNESHAAWKGLMDTGALQAVREHNALQLSGRRLAFGLGGAPLGVFAVIAVAIGEILIHCEMFIKNFFIPQYAWVLILIPMQVVSSLACAKGVNVYCDTIMGFMGLNSLDATFVLFCNKGLFGTGAAANCAKKMNPGPTILQKSMVNAVMGTLPGGTASGDLFPSFTADGTTPVTQHSR